MSAGGHQFLFFLEKVSTKPYHDVKFEDTCEYIDISILYVSECCTVKGTRNIQRVFMALKLFCMVL